MVAPLGEIEGRLQAKGIRSVKTPKGTRAGKGPIQVMRMQMWADSLAAGVDRNKIGGQPNALLLELWRNWDQSSSLVSSRSTHSQRFWAVQLKDDLVPDDDPFDDAFFHFEQNSDQGACLKNPNRDQRLQVELGIHWSLANVQRVMALVDTGVKCNLLYSKSEPLSCVVWCRFRTVYCKGCVLGCATNLWFSCRFRAVWKHLEFCGWAVENTQKMPLLEGVGPVPVGGFAGL